MAPSPPGSPSGAPSSSTTDGTGFGRLEPHVAQPHEDASDVTEHHVGWKSRKVQRFQQWQQLLLSGGILLLKPGTLMLDARGQLGLFLPRERLESFASLVDVGLDAANARADRAQPLRHSGGVVHFKDAKTINSQSQSRFPVT
eukprot:3812169-Prymnesium_polylepis.2